MRSLAGLSESSAREPSFNVDPLCQLEASFVGNSLTGEELFQIMLEGLRNARHHGAARSVHISLAGTSILLNGTNGQSGATYYLMTTTNVALPLSEWKTVGTNVGAGNIFSFTGTGAVNSSLGHQFYILSSTNYNP